MGHDGCRWRRTLFFPALRFPCALLRWSTGEGNAASGGRAGKLGQGKQSTTAGSSKQAGNALAAAGPAAGAAAGTLFSCQWTQKHCTLFCCATASNLAACCTFIVVCGAFVLVAPGSSAPSKGDSDSEAEDGDAADEHTALLKADEPSLSRGAGLRFRRSALNVRVAPREAPVAAPRPAMTMEYELPGRLSSPLS